MAVGYDELNTYTLGEPPEEPESIEGHAAFRAWVEATFHVTVPDEWPEVGDDDFTAWVDERVDP